MLLKNAMHMLSLHFYFTGTVVVECTNDTSGRVPCMHFRVTCVISYQFKLDFEAKVRQQLYDPHQLECQFLGRSVKFILTIYCTVNVNHGSSPTI